MMIDNIGPTNYSWHMWLWMMGYNVLMCESFMSLYNRNSWSSMHSKRTRNNLHWILQAIGCTMAFAGMIILYNSRGFRLRSIHSKLGFGSNILIILGVLNGSSTIWAAKLRRLVKPVYIKLLHNLTGSLCFTMGMASLIYGFEKSHFRNYSTPETVLTIQLISALTVVLSMFGPLSSLGTQIVGSFPWIFDRFEKKDSFEGVEEQRKENMTSKA